MKYRSLHEDGGDYAVAWWSCQYPLNSADGLAFSDTVNLMDLIRGFHPANGAVTRNLHEFLAVPHRLMEVAVRPASALDAGTARPPSPFHPAVWPTRSDRASHATGNRAAVHRPTVRPPSPRGSAYSANLSDDHGDCRSRRPRTVALAVFVNCFQHVACVVRLI